MHGMKDADKHYGEREYGSDKQAQSQAQGQTQARPSQRAPIAAGSLKWQSCIRSLIGKWQILKGRQNWIFKVCVPAAALETPRGSQSRLQF